MAHRHEVQGKARGGAATKAEVVYGNKQVLEAARKKKDGGAVEKKQSGGSVSGGAGSKRLGKYERGGSVKKYATGGGADKHPFSSAHFAKGGSVKSGK